MFAPDGEWDGRPLYKSTAAGSDAALYWCRGSDEWMFAPSWSALTEERKRSGASRAYRQADGGRVPVGVAPQTWRCWIDKEWQDRPLTVKALRTPADGGGGSLC